MVKKIDSDRFASFQQTAGAPLTGDEDAGRPTRPAVPKPAAKSVAAEAEDDMTYEVVDAVNQMFARKGDEEILDEF